MAWTADDFVDTPEARLRKRQRQVDLLELRKAQIAERKQMALMKAKKFDESLIPEWARMTPEEAAKRR
jgi:hypothetical protein